MNVSPHQFQIPSAQVAEVQGCCSAAESMKENGDMLALGPEGETFSDLANLRDPCQGLTANIGNVNLNGIKSAFAKVGRGRNCMKL